MKRLKTREGKGPEKGLKKGLQKEAKPEKKNKGEKGEKGEKEAKKQINTENNQLVRNLLGFPRIIMLIFEITTVLRAIQYSP